jgi:Leucine-rich repeat (LRR) protein
MSASQAVFQVGEVQLEFSPECSASIDDALYLNVWGVATPALGELWSGYESDSKVGFRLSLRNIHRAGIPVGEAHFEAGRSSNYDHYLWDDGWVYALEFTGSALLADGWLEMRGEMAPQYEDSPRASVLLRWPVPLETLDWSAYRFASLEETEGADPLVVSKLELADLETEELPGRILEFRNLRSLRLRNLPLRTLTPDMALLSRLEDLHVYGAALSEVPATLGQLQQLSWLEISHCRLQSTPDELWSLPALRRLDLSKNCLTALPETVGLPELRNLDVADNQLTTLPAAFALLPSLRSLSLENNPLVSLPQAFAEIPLELSLADKMRLLDFRYRGAGGGGVIEWDDSVYAATSLPAGVPQELRGLALHSLSLRQVESTAAVGATRFGGWPDLPAGLEYPRYRQEEQDYCYEFIAQLNCAELADLQGYLPRTGRLYFFLSNIHDMVPLVLYREEEDLVDGSSLTLNADQFFDTWEVPYPAFAVEATSATSLPSGYAARSNSHLFEGEAAALAEQDELLDELREKHRPAGQHEVHCHVFTQHESPQLEAALKHRGHPKDWIVLLKVASAGGFQWGDAGELFYVMHKSDLARRDFSAIYCTCESS